MVGFTRMDSVGLMAFYHFRGDHLHYCSPANEKFTGTKRLSGCMGSTWRWSFDFAGFIRGSHRISSTASNNIRQTFSCLGLRWAALHGNNYRGLVDPLRSKIV